MKRSLRRGLIVALLLVLLVYAAIHAMVWRNAMARLAQAPPQPADAALILGNRAWRDGKPNPCLTGRVDAGIALARAGLVRQLVFSGGVDREDGRIEAEVMRQHARDAGFEGPLLLEARSQTTRENLSLSRAELQAAGIRSVVIVTEPYHLWRAERLARASGFDRQFEVQFAAAPSACWQRWGMAFKGALREPLAIVNNAANGFLH